MDHGDASRAESVRRQKSSHSVDEGEREGMIKTSYAFRNRERSATSTRKNAVESQVRRVGRGEIPGDGGGGTLEDRKWMEECIDLFGGEPANRRSSKFVAGGLHGANQTIPWSTYTAC